MSARKGPVKPVFSSPGQIVELESGSVDYVEITDGDGTTLGRFGGGYYMDEGDNGPSSIEGSGNEEQEGNRNRISDITSFTETVHVLFHTDDSVTRRGWRLEWSK